MFAQEDALIKNVKRSTFYQIKHSVDYWTWGRLRETFNRATEILEQDAQLHDMLRVLKDELYTTISEELKKKRMFVDQLLTLEDLQDCLRRIYLLESTPKSGGSSALTDQQIRDGSGLTILMASLPARATGVSLFSWDTWVEHAKGTNTDPCKTATRQVVAGKSIRRRLEDEILGAIDGWAQDPKQSQLHLISGGSGSGRTWLLFRIVYQEALKRAVLTENSVRISTRILVAR
jgi:hypothetical protein